MSLYAPKSARRAIDIEALKVTMADTNGDVIETARRMGCTTTARR